MTGRARPRRSRPQDPVLRGARQPKRPRGDARCPSPRGNARRPPPAAERGGSPSGIRAPTMGDRRGGRPCRAPGSSSATGGWSRTCSAGWAGMTSGWAMSGRSATASSRSHSPGARTPTRRRSPQIGCGLATSRGRRSAGPSSCSAKRSRRRHRRGAESRGGPSRKAQLAGATGFEPAISCVTGRCVNQATPRPRGGSLPP